MSTMTELEEDTVLQSVVPCAESSARIERTPASQELTTPAGPAFATTRTAEPPLGAYAQSIPSLESISSLESIPSLESSPSMAAIQPVGESSLTPSTRSASAPSFDPIEPLPHESALVGPLVAAPLAEFSPLRRSTPRTPAPPYPWEWALLGFCGTLLLVVAVLHRQGGLERFHGILSRSRAAVVDGSGSERARLRGGEPSTAGKSSAEGASSEQPSAAAAPSRPQAPTPPNATAAWAAPASHEAFEAPPPPNELRGELIAARSDIAHAGSTPDAAEHERVTAGAALAATKGEPAAASAKQADRGVTASKAAGRASKRRKARSAAKEGAVAHAPARPERLGEPSPARGEPVSSTRTPKRRSVAAGLALELPP